MPIIILEGTDKSGKTTLAEFILKKLGNKAIYYKAKKVDFMDSNIDLSLQLLFENNFLSHLNSLNPDKYIIVDRNLWTEYAYSKLYNRKTNIENIDKSFCLIRGNAFLLYLTAEINDLYERFKEEKEVDFKYITELQRYYLEAIHKYKLTKFKSYNTTYFRVEQIFKNMKKEGII